VRRKLNGFRRARAAVPTQAVRDPVASTPLTRGREAAGTTDGKQAHSDERQDGRTGTPTEAESPKSREVAR